MKILIVGGAGTIGQAVVNELSSRHTMIVAGRKHGDVHVDLTDQQSIKKMYQSLGKIDAVVMATGHVEFLPLKEMTAAIYGIGLQSKLMGQVNMVLLGMPSIHDDGSFTLTSGILNRDPIRCGSSAAMVNGALDGFVKSAALEMPRGIRINVVSPTVLSESMLDFSGFFRGFVPVPAHEVAQAYSKSVEGQQTGQIYRVGGFV